MNFFKLYIGDYQRDTAHLSITEHGAYLLMLQHYYATEAPLPKGKALHRMLRAQDKVERDAIDTVAGRFWTESGAGLVNERAAEEIRKASHQRTVNRETGKRGGRPKQTERLTDSETDSVSETEPNNNPIQTPDSSESLRRLRDSALSAPLGDPPQNPRAALFAIGKTILGASSGGLISEAIANIGEPRVGKVLGEMALSPKADPRAYFVAATRSGHSEVVV